MSLASGIDRERARAAAPHPHGPASGRMGWDEPASGHPAAHFRGGLIRGGQPPHPPAIGVARLGTGG